MWHVTLTVALCADIPCDEVLSPTSKSSRSDSRTSFGSIFDSPMKDKSMERVSAGLAAGLNNPFMIWMLMKVITIFGDGVGPSPFRKCFHH